MSDRRPRPGIHNHCPTCLGWGFHVVRKGTDYQDEIDCTDCNGTGVRQHQDCPRCAHPAPGMPAHNPSPRCHNLPRHVTHCTCRACH